MGNGFTPGQVAVQRSLVALCHCQVTPEIHDPWLCMDCSDGLIIRPMTKGIYKAAYSLARNERRSGIERKFHPVIEAVFAARQISC